MTTSSRWDKVVAILLAVALVVGVVAFFAALRACANPKTFVPEPDAELPYAYECDNADTFPAYCEVPSMYREGKVAIVCTSRYQCSPVSDEE